MKEDIKLLPFLEKLNTLSPDIIQTILPVCFELVDEYSKKDTGRKAIKEFSKLMAYSFSQRDLDIFKIVAGDIPKNQVFQIGGKRVNQTGRGSDDEESDDESTAIIPRTGGRAGAPINPGTLIGAIGALSSPEAQREALKLIPVLQRQTLDFELAMRREDAREKREKLILSSRAYEVFYRRLEKYGRNVGAPIIISGGLSVAGRNLTNTALSSVIGIASSIAGTGVKYTIDGAVNALFSGLSYIASAIGAGEITTRIQLGNAIENLMKDVDIGATGMSDQTWIFLSVVIFLILFLLFQLVNYFETHEVGFSATIVSASSKSIGDAPIDTLYPTTDEDFQRSIREFTPSTRRSGRATSVSRRRVAPAITDAPTGRKLTRRKYRFAKH